jgi:hypothetical protein
MSSLIKMSSVCPSDDLLIVRITGLAAGAGAGFGAGAAGFGVSTDKGFIALRILDWLVAPGVLAVGKVAVGICTGLVGVLGFGVVGVGLFAMSFFAPATLVVTPGFIAVAGLAVSCTAPVFFGAVGAVVLATKYSCALKTFKQEPQRTAPLADCSWLGVTRKAVPHLGQRVIIWLLAEVMVYLLLTQGGPQKPIQFVIDTQQCNQRETYGKFRRQSVATFSIGNAN